MVALQAVHYYSWPRASSEEQGRHTTAGVAAKEDDLDLACWAPFWSGEALAIRSSPPRGKAPKLFLGISPFRPWIPS
eukprot:7393903-Pyramimonas_sp.AAC.1